MPHIFIERTIDDYSLLLARAFDWLGLSARLVPGTRVAIKPNLTFPSFRPGVMTNPAVLDALIRLLKDCSCQVTVVESDSGGYNRFSMDEVFTATGIRNLAQKFDVQLINLSSSVGRPMSITVRRRELSVPIPAFLLDSTDFLLTVPVPKVHLNTGVSLSVKNQWGIIQNPSDRLRLHPDFAEVIYAVNKAMPPIISIIDGKYGLTRSGPMEGDPVELNWVMVADDLFRADFLCCQLMGIDPFSVGYLRSAFRKEGIGDLSNVRLNRDPSEFVTSPPFFLRRKWTDYPGLWAFNSRFLAYVAYRSPLAGLLHRLLYLFRTPFYDYR
jgi:uncharacterized protein (DUF362 family)